MNIENLTKGQIIKNYKELCNLIGEKPLTSNSKKSQLKELERYVSYHNEGHKFIIDEIYEEPKPKKDNRGKDGLYIDDVQAMIINLLLNSKENKVLLSYGKLFKATNMTNDNYIEGRNNIDKLSEITEISKEVCYDFYNYTQTSLKQKLESALKGLEKESLINFQKSYIIAKIVVEHNIFGEPWVVNGKLKTHIEHRMAEENERLIILYCEQEALKELKAKNKQDVYIKGDWKKFKKLVQQKLRENGNIAYYYEGYSIVFNQDYIDYYLNKNELIDVVKERLNDNICLMIKRYANNKRETVEAKFFVPFGGQADKYNDIYTKEDYLVSIDVLIDTVIDDEARDIREELKKGINPKNIKEEELERFDLNDELPF